MTFRGSEVPAIAAAAANKSDLDLLPGRNSGPELPVMNFAAKVWFEPKTNGVIPFVNGDFFTKPQHSRYKTFFPIS